VASVGPSYTTKRVEQAEMMNQLFQSFPESFQVLGDIFMENQDGPGTDRMAKRLKAMLPPPAAQADEDEEQAIPPQVQAQMQQLQAQLQEGKSIVEELMQENDQLKAEKQAKDAEIRAKIYAEDEATNRTKIQSLASITVAEMNNETKELLAGMQHALSQAQMVNDQQNQFIEKLMQMQQVEHSQSLEVANTQHSQGMDLRNADNAEQQQQFSQQQAMEQQALAAQQAQQTPPAGG
jgi:FAD/FMN-containing dehydrogenase